MGEIVAQGRHQQGEDVQLGKKVNSIGYELRHRRGEYKEYWTMVVWLVSSTRRE
jgi:hypothetical protein